MLDCVYYGALRLMTNCGRLTGHLVLHSEACFMLRVIILVITIFVVLKLGKKAFRLSSWTNLQTAITIKV